MAELQVLYFGGDVYESRAGDTPSVEARLPRRRGIVIVQNVATDVVLWVYGKVEATEEEERLYYGRRRSWWIDLSDILTLPMLNSIGKLVVADPATISLGVLRTPYETIPGDAHTANKIQDAALSLVKALVPGENHW